MTPLVGGGGVPSTAMHPATLAVGGQATATMIKRQGPGGRTVAGNALLICTKGMSSLCMKSVLFFFEQPVSRCKHFRQGACLPPSEALQNHKVTSSLWPKPPRCLLSWQSR